MSNLKTVVTPKGTELPLLNLKGKSYLQVAHRLQWFVEENESYHIATQFSVLTDEQTVAKAVINILDKDGRVIKSATATKRETRDQFPDHTEKAETGAIGRALVALGYGTSYALSDLEEGMRLADAPLTSVKETRLAEVTQLVKTGTGTTGSFRNAKEEEEF